MELWLGHQEYTFKIASYGSGSREYHMALFGGHQELAKSSIPTPDVTVSRYQIATAKRRAQECNAYTLPCLSKDVQCSEVL
jgi:hypothetical protein